MTGTRRSSCSTSSASNPNPTRTSRPLGRRTPSFSWRSRAASRAAAPRNQRQPHLPQLRRLREGGVVRGHAAPAGVRTAARVCPDSATARPHHMMGVGSFLVAGRSSVRINAAGSQHRFVERVASGIKARSCLRCLTFGSSLRPCGVGGQCRNGCPKGLLNVGEDAPDHLPTLAPPGHLDERAPRGVITPAAQSQPVANSFPPLRLTSCSPDDTVASWVITVL